MADGGISTALLIASAASTGAGLVASGKQSSLERANLKLETEQAKLAGAETALQSATSFRQNLSSQLAIASLRGGNGGSLVNQFGSTSMANFLADQGAITSRQKFIDANASNKRSQISANRFSRDVSALGSLFSSGLESINLNKTKDLIGGG